MKIRKSNYILTIVTTSLVLFFLGLYVLFFLHSKQLGKQIKEQANIVVELADNLPEEQKSSLQTMLESNPKLVKGSVQYVSKEEGLALMKEDLDLTTIQIGDDNPLKDIYEFNVYEEFLNFDSLEALKEAFIAKPEIISVVYQDEFYDSISKRINSFSRIFFVFSLLFLIISVVLIHNTFFLRLQGDQAKIKTMEFVGADWAFIKKPYLKESYKVAFYAWLVSSLLILIVLGIITLSYPEIVSFLSLLNFIWSFLFMAIISFGICSLSARSIINRYFKANPDRL
jgi:cell division transport system permease protein